MSVSKHLLLLMKTFVCRLQVLMSDQQKKILLDMTDYVISCLLATVNVIELQCTAQKMKFSIKGFFSKCDQSCRKLRIWSHLLKKSFMENFIFCVLLGSVTGPKSYPLTKNFILLLQMSECFPYIVSI